MIALITVVYKNYSMLEEYFHTLKSQTDTNFHLFIIDLSDNPVSINVPNYLTSVSIYYDTNKGYAYGVNRGIDEAIKAGYSQFIITNNDVEYTEKCLAETKLALKKYPNTIIGGKIYYAKGYEYHKYDKKDLGNVLWYAGGIIDYDHATTNHRGIDEIDRGEFEIPCKTDFVSGCFMAFSKSVFDKVGYFDKNYFMYFEDSDYAIRAKQQSIECMYIPNIVIYHKESQSSGGSKSSKLRENLMTKNRVLFALKYMPLKTKLYILFNYCLYILRLRKGI